MQNSIILDIKKNITSIINLHEKEIELKKKRFLEAKDIINKNLNESDKLH